MDRNAAEDAVQVTFMRMQQQKIGLRGRLLPTLLKVAEYVCREAKRDMNKHGHAGRVSRLKTDRAVESMIDVAREEDLVWRIIERHLTEQERHILELKYLRGLEGAQIGLLIGEDEEVKVRHRVRKIKLKMQAELEKLTTDTEFVRSALHTLDEWTRTVLERRDRQGAPVTELDDWA